jgi:hypothetical protein
MDRIIKGTPVQVDGASEPMVASRDEYQNRIWVMTERDYRMQSASPDAPRGKEEPYLVLPDKSLIRDYQHGFPDEKGQG